MAGNNFSKQLTLPEVNVVGSQVIMQFGDLHAFGDDTQLQLVGQLDNAVQNMPQKRVGAGAGEQL